MLFIQDLIKDYSTLVELPVQWGDMDAMQHVNNIVYLRYFETARIKYFNEHLSLLADPSGIGPILAEVSCRYKFPVTYPDTIIAGARPLMDTLTEFSIDIQQVVISQKHNRVAAEGKSKIVFYDYITKKKAAISSEMIELIRKSYR